MVERLHKERFLHLKLLPAEITQQAGHCAVSSPAPSEGKLTPSVVKAVRGADREQAHALFCAAASWVLCVPGRKLKPGVTQLSPSGQILELRFIRSS